MIYQPAVRSFSGLAYSKFAAIEGASPRGGDQGSGGDLSLLAVFPGRERPHDVAPGRIEGPNSVVSLVLDLHQHERGINVLVGLRIELNSLPRVDNLVTGNVRCQKSLHDRFGICGFGPVERVSQHEGSRETTGGVVTHWNVVLFLV